ncbi:unnamed protein product, partial [Iphiclides podalirius]
MQTSCSSSLRALRCPITAQIDLCPRFCEVIIFAPCRDPTLRGKNTDSLELRSVTNEVKNYCSKSQLPPSAVAPPPVTPGAKSYSARGVALTHTDAGHPIVDF